MRENWVICVLDNDYEINTIFPNQIRRISNKRIITESVDKTCGYIRCSMNGKRYLKHRIIATQFIPNPNGYTVVDHINRNKFDNRIENLRWTNQSENCKNKSSHLGKTYTIFNYGDEPEDLIEVEEYGKHIFKNYYYSPEKNKFYLDTGVNFREIPILMNKKGLAYVMAEDTEQHRVSICFNKFKRIHGF